MTAPEKPRVRVRLVTGALGAHAADDYMDVGADAVTFDRGELVLWLLGAEQASFALAEVAGLELPDVAAAFDRSGEDKAYTLDEKRALHPNAYKPWTPKEDERLLVRHAEGADEKTLSFEFGRNRGAICSRLRKLGAA